MNEKQWELFDENGELVNTIVATDETIWLFIPENGYVKSLETGEILPMEPEEYTITPQMKAQHELMWTAFEPEIEGRLTPEQIIKHEKAFKAIGFDEIIESAKAALDTHVDMNLLEEIND